MAAKKKKKTTKSKPKPKHHRKAPARAKARPKAKARPARAKPKAKATPKAKARKAAPRRAVRRRDRPGHIDPKYAKGLRARSGGSDEKEQRRPAFRVKEDDVAEELGEEVVGKATTGEDEGEDVANADYVEEVGGPFVVTTGGEEYAEGTDESNPEDSTVEPFPKT